MSLHGLVPKPEGATWTDDQWSAITARGANLLVAAAAGSGKTAVLVERLIRMVTDEQNPIDVDRLLVTTYTKAASEEMRHRIRDAMEKKLLAEGESVHIARQLALLPRAAISTMHSFCMEVIRQNFVDVGLDPQFRVGNDIEIELLQNDVLEEVLEAFYRSGDEAFFDLVDSFSSDRSDDKIFKLVLELYGFAQANPFPKQWMLASLEPFRTASDETIPMEVRLGKWMQVLLDSFLLQAEGWLADLQQGLSLCEADAGLVKLEDLLREEVNVIKDAITLAQTGDWAALTTHLTGFEFPNMPSIRSNTCDAQLKEQAKALRDQVRKAYKDTVNSWFGRSLEQHTVDIAQSFSVLDALVRLTIQFSEAYQEAKKERNVVDYSDLEHYTLAILRDREAPEGELRPSSVALGYQARFDEVLVDEYQDANQVQESIVYLLSRPNPGNRFMVGDVKQSIYRFRLAEPNLFLGKYQSFASITSVTEQSPGVKIDLARNFRSRSQVVNGINFLFRQLMQPKVAEIDYDEAAELKLGATYPEAAHRCEVVLIQDGVEEVAFEPSEEAQEANKQETENLSKIEKEARYVADRIRAFVDKGFVVYDGKAKQMRPVTYRDIVVLMRSPKAAAPIYEEAFKAQGIPSYAEMNSGYFDAVEISTILSLLHVVDNPNQDIPLAAVLRSPIFAFTTEQLAAIRLAAPKASFYAACLVRTEQDDVLARVLTQLETWRDQARSMALSEFLWMLYRDTGYFDGVGAWPGGIQRQANLRALIDRAKQYEASQYRGLFRFLRFLERLQENGTDLGTAQSIGESEDVVRIMSIHKSKGLEFPVVFVADLTRKFSTQDITKPFIMHRDLGFGPKRIHHNQRVNYPTMSHLALSERLQKENVAEEMRILYVALTRAKEKLILIGTVADAAKAIGKWTRFLSESELALPQSSVAGARNYLDWIGPALIRHPHAELWRNTVGASPRNLRSEDPSEWNFFIVDANTLTAPESNRESQVDGTTLEALRKGQPLPVSEPIDAEVERQLAWVDAGAGASKIFAKISVSELKRRTEDPTPGEEMPASKIEVSLDRPQFLQTSSLTPTERGTAYHTVMQHLPLTTLSTDIAAILDGLVAKQLLTGAQRAGIADADIAAFVASPLYAELAGATEVYRELPFSLGIPAGELHPELADVRVEQPILMQGVIDCLYVHGDDFVLLDYKTDRVTTPAAVGERYRKQLELYAKAIEQMTGRPVTRRLLYLFDGGHIVEV